MKKWLIILAFAATIFTLSNCEIAIGKNSAPLAPVNPNGDSELALLMREMFDEGMKMKKQIVKGKKPKIKVDFEKIHTAHATEPEKAASEEFKAFAQSYVSMMKALEKAEPEEALGIYTSVVNTCMSCHKVLCPGPTMKIEKMYIPENK